MAAELPKAWNERTAAWADATLKRQRITAIEDLPPDVSMGLHIARRARTRDGLFKIFGRLTDEQVLRLVYDLDFWARPEQIPPLVFVVCIFLAGRGWGKTWSGSRFVIRKAMEGKTHGALIGPTAAAVRDTMILGPSGILALSPPWFTPIYEPSKRRLTWPNGIQAIGFSADKPRSLRGLNAGWGWGDEPASWKNNMEALDQLPYVVRIGTKSRPPQTFLTGTPEPLPKLEALCKQPGTIVRRGSSLANRANLAPHTVRSMLADLNTRWGKQEVLGLLLMNKPGAIFSAARWVDHPDDDPHAFAHHLARRIIAVDPAPTSDEGSDETGILVMGGREERLLRHVYVLGDRSMRASPRTWATEAIHAYVEFACECLVVEVNSGGEMVETLIETVAAEMGVEVVVKPVRAITAKSKRAEPVSALAETRRIHFVGQPEQYRRLKEQAQKFTGINGRRDDRVDTMCWGAHELALADQFFAY